MNARRLLACLVVVWACSCGIRGHVPFGVAQKASAAMTPATQMCMEWAVSWNRQAKLHANSLRVFGGMGRPYGEALARCVWFVGQQGRPQYGCYRGLIDSSLRTWQRPLLVDCQHPWAGKPVRAKPIA